MQEPILYRRRLIPNENILLKDDIILYADDNVVITKWVSLHAKTTFDHGFSCYFLQEGYKIGCFLRPDGSLYLWYCDIVEYIWNKDRSVLTTLDLLADVKIRPNGAVEVVDLDELADAREQQLITEEQVLRCLRSLNRLTTLIYKGRFEELISPLKKYM
ncbi:MAG: DUF402 domain-containing protein [Lachnospiraceae bacterium]